jgi:hypothetical protein
MWASLPPILFVGPAWTVSTLVFFYLLFPWLLRWHQNQTDRSLNRWIRILAVVQAVVFFALSFLIDVVDSWWAFWASHAWPISRLLVFDMGLVEGFSYSVKAALIAIPLSVSWVFPPIKRTVGRDVSIGTLVLSPFS